MNYVYDHFKFVIKRFPFWILGSCSFVVAQTYSDSFILQVLITAAIVAVVTWICIKAKGLISSKSVLPIFNGQRNNPNN